MKKKNLIKKSKRVPQWKRNLNATVKSLKQGAWNALAGLGLVTLLVLVVKLIGGV